MDIQPELPSCVLVVEDQEAVRSALRLLLKSAGYKMVGADSPSAAVALVGGSQLAAAIVDMNFTADTTSGAEGLALIEALLRHRPELPIIAMTAWASIDLAVEAMRRGASDFIEKPWQNTRLLNVLACSIGRGPTHRSERAMAQVGFQEDSKLVAESPAMRSLLSDLMRLSESDASIMLLGENGTGKSLLASVIHSWSPRKSRPFVKIDVGGIMPTLFESEMFGHVRGAFTDAKQDRIGRLEAANEGTVFLDEIGNLPLELQPKLLRALDTGELERLGSSKTVALNVRTISATNSDLTSEVSAGRFRQDLLYRLNTFVARVPPLRERQEDIEPLALHYLASFASRYRRDVAAISINALEALRIYPWPGNIRELAHVMERSVLLAKENEVQVEDLRLATTTPTEPPSMSLEENEAMLLRKTLAQNTGSVQRTADQLGISRQSLYRRMDKHGIRGHGSSI